MIATVPNINFFPQRLKFSDIQITIEAYHCLEIDDHLREMLNGTDNSSWRALVATQYHMDESILCKWDVKKREHKNVCACVYVCIYIYPVTLEMTRQQQTK